MIPEFVASWDQRKGLLRAELALAHPADYGGLLQSLVRLVLHDPENYETPEPSRIERVDFGDYQGTLVFVIGAGGYQPRLHWAISIDYGSCSVCDTFERIGGYDDEAPTEEQVNDYMTLALHMVQGLALIEPDRS